MNPVVVTSTTESRRPSEEASPNLTYKLPMKEGVTKEGIVFVVDNDASCGAALKELFESVGLKIKLYASGSAFLEDRFQDATSCLVLAVRLPGMSGLKFKGNWRELAFTSRSFSLQAMETFRWRCTR